MRNWIPPVFTQSEGFLLKWATFPMQSGPQPTLTKFQPMVTVAWFHSTPLTNHRTESGLREFSCKIANQRKGIYVPLYCFLLKSSKSNEMEWMTSRDVVYANFFFCLVWGLLLFWFRSNPTESRMIQIVCPIPPIRAWN